MAGLDKLHLIDTDTLAWWLSDRQLAVNGGFNGRPEKKADVCYAWWVFSPLCILQKQHWIDGDFLRDFILSAQDEDDGGIADRPGDVADVYHTLFGLAGLGMMQKDGVKEIDVVYCLPAHVTQRLGLYKKY